MLFLAPQPDANVTSTTTTTTTTPPTTMDLACLGEAADKRTRESHELQVRYINAYWTKAISCLSYQAKNNNKHLERV